MGKPLKEHLRADLCARAFLTAAKIIEDGTYDALLTKRYAGRKLTRGAKMLTGELSLSEIEDLAVREKIEPQPRSGKQEQIENLLARLSTPMSCKPHTSS